MLPQSAIGTTMRARKSLASNEEWRAWGKLDPLYGVATIPGHAKNAANPWTDESFYEIGAIDWNLFRCKWEHYGVSPGTCVEIGCGAGRLTAHLARYFRYVHGLDVSVGMIEYARPRMPANVSLHLDLKFRCQTGVPMPCSQLTFCSISQRPLPPRLIFAKCTGSSFQVAPPCFTLR
jgi:SAM-dependent methyltransferase